MKVIPLPVLILVSVTCLGAQSQSGIDAIFAPLMESRSPGAAVLVRKNGRTIFQRDYGVRDLRTLRKIDSRTNFRLASCTKQFTAMATMLLVHDGRLKYDTRLPGVFPEFPGYGRAITIRHLLTHTSGLPDYEDLMGDTWTPTHQIQDDEVLSLLKQAKPKFAPGTNWAYSNSGYVLLGLIVARISGLPFPQFLHDRIFQPLHMTGSLAYVKGKTAVPQRAFGHTKEKNRFIESDQSATSATLGDGGVYSNLDDLEKWDAALDNHSLLSQEEMRPALLPAMLSDGSTPRWPEAPGEDNLSPGKPVVYGFGWFLDPYSARARMWHFGSTMGFGTAIERFTQEELTIIILCNRTDLDPGKLALQVADLVAP
jgi:CubicO group peptidase (beta-lactamase class C family)